MPDRLVGHSQPNRARLDASSPRRLAGSFRILCADPSVPAELIAAAQGLRFAKR